MSAPAEPPDFERRGHDRARNSLGHLDGADERAARLRPLVAQLQSIDAEDFLWVVRTLFHERCTGFPLTTSTGVPVPPSE